MVLETVYNKFNSHEQKMQLSRHHSLYFRTRKSALRGMHTPGCPPPPLPHGTEN